MSQPETPDDAVAVLLAKAVRARRTELGLTLEALSGRTGLSKGFLSQMESGGANPTLNTLAKVAEALRVPTERLLASQGPDPEPAAVALAATPEAPGVVLRTTRRPARAVGLWPPGAGRTYHLSGPGARRFQVLLVDGAASHHEVAVTHDGEEFCLVLAGAVTIDVDGRGYELGTGEALHYDSSVPHRITAADPAVPTRVLLVV